MPPTFTSPVLASYNLDIRFARLDLLLPVPPIMPIVSPDLMCKLMLSSTFLFDSSLYANETLLKSILPSLTVLIGSGLFIMSGLSFNTSVILSALAALIVIITNIIESIISDIIILII